MNACIIAVGTEMLTPFRVDTNSLFITERLNEIGVDVRLKVVAGDDVEEIADLLRRALRWADVIAVTGGLGPTEDDVTRDSLAHALDLPLDIDESIAERIRERFARRGMTMPEINRRQALVPRGAIVLPNPNGTAPGLWIEQGRCAIVLLPGPPREMKPMFEAVIRERLGARSGGTGLFRRVLRITGRTESDVDTRAQPVSARGRRKRSRSARRSWRSLVKSSCT
jgi:nicotinamide-nucleotide amidase